MSAKQMTFEALKCKNSKLMFSYDYFTKRAKNPNDGHASGPEDSRRQIQFIQQ